MPRTEPAEDTPKKKREKLPATDLVRSAAKVAALDAKIKKLTPKVKELADAKMEREKEMQSIRKLTASDYEAVEA